MIIDKAISQLDTMYPSFSVMLEPGDQVQFPAEMRWCSIYGFSFGMNTIKIGDRLKYLEGGQYFSFWTGENSPEFSLNEKLLLIVRLGYKCQDTTGWVEAQGRLSYIDGCTDSLLVYPPRHGDPSLNLLYFPHGIEQTRHLHPSVRVGCVISGHGFSDVWEAGNLVSNPLNAGDHFCLTENELHRFRTEDSHMTVIAWHPDGDWGPTDHNHTMLNRTYTR